MSVAAGVWRCTTCQFDVWASKSECRKCGKKRPTIVGNTIVNTSRREGDWDCPSCKRQLFASRTACDKCGAVKPTAQTSAPVAKQAMTAARRPGDWECAGCQDVNWGSRTVCRKCNEPKPGVASEAKCVICLEARADYAPRACNQLCLCAECSATLVACPLCRADFATMGDVVRIYVAS